MIDKSKLRQLPSVDDIIDRYKHLMVNAPYSLYVKKIRSILKNVRVEIQSGKNVKNMKNYVFKKIEKIFKETSNTNMKSVINGTGIILHTGLGRAPISEEIMKKNNLCADDVAWLVPHQANQRIIDATAKRMGVGNEKVMINIEKYGNTTNGTIPLCLWEWEAQLKKGDNLILAAFGGGFTWGSIYLKWAYDSNK